MSQGTNMDDEDKQHSIKHYRLYGLKLKTAVSSHRIFDNYLPADDNDHDVLIEFGTISEKGKMKNQIYNGWFKLSDDCILYAGKTFKALVHKGRLITIESFGDIDKTELEGVVFQSLLSVILQQRGYLPLKASAVVRDGKAIIFLGNSDSGKTTISKKFIQEGAQHLARGVVVIKQENGDIYAYPGIGRETLTMEQHCFHPVEISGICKKNDDDYWDDELYIVPWSTVLLDSIFIHVIKSGEIFESIESLALGIEEDKRIKGLVLPGYFRSFAHDEVMSYIKRKSEGASSEAVS